MKKRKFICLSFINITILIAVFVVIFMYLPQQIQKSLSFALYTLAGLTGLIIGSLIAKVFYLHNKIEKEKNDLEKKQENIQIYLSNIVHDLRSPVASINMISELLEDDLENIEPQHKELITSIRKSSTTMLDNICCILDNARAQQTTPFKNLKKGDPSIVITSVVKKHHILAIDKDIEIQVATDNCKEAYFDEDALDSILSNLMSNAIKYSMPKTTVNITTSFSRNSLSIHIKDNGLGMTKDDLSKVFGRFEKLSARPTAGEDSSGLGLSIVKNLAEKMHGSVKVTSPGKGKGSTFSVSIPTTPIAESKSA